jgi:DNA-binding IclR family transcriptional regulator
MVTNEGSVEQRGKARKEQRGIQAMEVGGQFLRYLADAGQPMSLAELSAASSVPPNQVFTYMVSLLRTGLIKRDAVTGRYEPGPLSLSLGLHALSQLPAVRHAVQPALELAMAANHSVLIAAWADRGPTVVQCLEPSTSLHAGIHVGTVMSIVHTTTGRVFGAYKPTEVIGPMVSQDIHSQAPLGDKLTTRQFEDLLADVRRRGLARGEGLPIPGINSLSAPVFDPTGEIVLVITLFGVSSNFDVSWKGKLAENLTRACKAISSQC